MPTCRRVVLIQHPSGLPKASDFETQSLELGQPDPGQVLLEVGAISVDAFIRTTLDGDGIHGTVALGAPLTDPDPASSPGRRRTCRGARS